LAGKRVLAEANTLLGGFSETGLEHQQIPVYYGLSLLRRGERRIFLIWAQKRIYCRKKENW
jgi:hypothetical protein